MVPLALVANLPTRWRHLHVPTSIGSKVGHQVGPLELLHCLELSCWHYQLVLSWYLHQPESHQLSFTNLLDGPTYWRTSGPKDRTPGLPGSNRNVRLLIIWKVLIYWLSIAPTKHIGRDLFRALFHDLFSKCWVRFAKLVICGSYCGQPAVADNRCGDTLSIGWARRQFDVCLISKKLCWRWIHSKTMELWFWLRPHSMGFSQ